MRIDHLPHALYRFYDAQGRLLYIGIAIDFLARWRKHRKREWWPAVTRMEIARYPNRESALAAERTAIIEERPRYNIQHNQLVMTNTRSTVGTIERLRMLTVHVLDAPWPAAGHAVRAFRIAWLSLALAGLLVPVAIVSAVTGSWVVVLVCAGACIGGWWRMALPILGLHPTVR